MMMREMGQHLNTDFDFNILFVHYEKIELYSIDFSTTHTTQAHTHTWSAQLKSS